MASRGQKINELVSILQDARKYYYSGNPILSDEEFDQLENILRTLDPENPYFKQVGADEGYHGFGKVKHDIPMRSMKKVNSADDAVYWLDKRFIGHPLDVIIEPKIDGFSASLKYENGRLSYVSTRGDGIVGTDITHIAPYMKDIPKIINIADPVEVRGEIYIPKDTSYDVARHKKTLKNIAVGITKRLDGKEDAKYLRFIAYDIIGLPFKTEEDKLEFLRKFFPNVIQHQRATKESDVVHLHTTYEKELRDKLPYEIDGIIVKVNDVNLQNKLEDNNLHHPNYAVAYKFKAKRYQTKLIDVEWNTGKSGKVTPVAIFEPINIEGKIVRRASLGSKRVFDELQLSIGDVIEVGLAGDVIPHVYKNVTKNKAA